MIRIRDIVLQPEHESGQLLYEAAKALKISASKIKKLTIFRRSVDARKKSDIRIVYTVDIQVDGAEKKILKASGCKRAAIAKYEHYRVPDAVSGQRPVVVGFGPAGMFAGLVLALAGLKPIILERGEDALARHEKVEKFFREGILDPDSNVQFGEGGAGTFSDGKLNTGVNNPRISWILEQFVAAGARENILYDAKPHIGTDVLITVVQNLRKRIEGLGGEVHFSTRVTGLNVQDGALAGVQTDRGAFPCKQAIFAIGHSARDTFEMLLERNIAIEPKPFAIGVRIEHPQSLIDKAQYGSEDLPLPPADYKLVRHLEDRTVYTFCMCPGGYVVAAASEEGGTVTNGMSYADRDGKNANAALLVTVNPSDFPYDGPLGGAWWQREIEQRAYSYSGSYKAPAQKVGDFLANRPSDCAGSVQPTYQPGVYWGDVRQVLPQCITDAIAQALPQLDGVLKGFASPDAVLTAPETRSSSPVRILRGDNRQASVKGFYPCGEGAGYAGGIMSAAIDGMMSAEALIAQIQA